MTVSQGQNPPHSCPRIAASSLYLHTVKELRSLESCGYLAALFCRVCSIALLILLINLNFES